MNNSIGALEKCANCGACLNICPVKAISVKSEGLFYKPTVDTEKCVNCGKCVASCPVENPSAAKAPKKALWGSNCDKEIVAKSSSGGIFAALADRVISCGGVVFSAAFNENCSEVHIKSSDEVPLEALLRSKYVESLVGDSFQKAKCELEKGREVLFCGTPCQIAGLHKFLGKEYDNLLSCDFACGGLSSHGLYQKHLKNLESKYHSAVKDVNFRPKSYGWNIHAIRVDFEGGRKYISPAVTDPYFCGFILKHVNTRDYCYDCDFAENHSADISLADFWCVGRLVGKVNHGRGLSLVLANTEKGIEALSRINNTCTLQEIDVEKASYNLKRRTYSESYMSLRSRYLQVCEDKGLSQGAEVIGVYKGCKKLVFKTKCRLKGLLYRFK